ncbi:MULTISPECIES: hypothetical protein [unclassified Bacillus (in: firmicutes)]|uniref:hypothetical protein n=1 Tax=unclassified Bacillus (in: firmicutes) TaxID=185979 RepID=UPI001BE6957D|nr:MULTISPECIES: hypothetical protein [unclassified Bacillus (in: firmicutes)]MBT2617730.1 hypothetical protein [Bacillus sp. ISL-78]MBT2631788.1 hypothetical protein [Bacillus sp. ISL-101]
MITLESIRIFCLYSLQAVGKEITYDLLEESNITNVGPITNEASYKSLNEQYPKLELKKEPAFIVFDENGLVLKTYDYEEMIDFLQNPEESFYRER